MIKEESELERKTKEYDTLPGHILGLDGWILRSIPEDRRKEFLTGYEKLLKVTLHPDRSQNPGEKERREKYLQSVSQAVTFLTTDSIAFDLAVDPVGTATSPIVRMRTTLESRETIVDELRKEISSLGVEKRELEALYQITRTTLMDAEQENKRLKGAEIIREKFRRLNVINMATYSPNLPGISLRGRYMSFKEGNVTNLTTWISKLNLSNITAEEYLAYVKEFKEHIEKNHLEEREKKMIFQKRRLEKKDGRKFTLIGNISLAGMLQYLMINYTIQNPIENSDTLSQSQKDKETTGLLANLMFTEKRNITNIKYMRHNGTDYSAFLGLYVEPRVGINLPLIVRESIVKGRRHKIKGEMVPYNEQTDIYRLFYAKEISQR